MHRGAGENMIKPNREIWEAIAVKRCCLSNLVRVNKGCRLPDLNQGQLDLQSSALPV